VTKSPHPLLWWGTNSTVLGKHPLDQHLEPHGASSRALNACESTDGNPPGYVGPTRSASFPTEVNNVVTLLGKSRRSTSNAIGVSVTAERYSISRLQIRAFLTYPTESIMTRAPYRSTVSVRAEPGCSEQG
jgi:hypothetical protein